VQVFRSIQNDDVVASIGRAKKRLVNVVPGVSAVTAKALSNTMENSTVDQVMIVLDADVESFRF